jgi:hypothetical protein
MQPNIKQLQKAVILQPNTHSKLAFDWSYFFFSAHAMLGFIIVLASSTLF